MTIKSLKAISGLLSVFGATGVVATTCLAVKEAPKAKEAMSNLDSNVPFYKKAFTFVKSYKWTFLSGALTIGSNITSSVIQTRTITSLSGAVAGLTALANNSDKFKKKAKEIIGEDKYNKIVQAVSKDEAKKQLPEKISEQVKDDRMLYWEKHLGFMLATENDIRRAHDALNYRLNKDSDAQTWIFDLEEFVDAAGAELLNKNISKKYLRFGWGVEHLNRLKGDTYIDIDEKLLTSDNEDDNGNIYRIIEFDYQPVYDPLHFEDAMYDETEIDGYLKATPEEFKEEMEKELEYGAHGKY